MVALTEEALNDSGLTKASLPPPACFTATVVLGRRRHPSSALGARLPSHGGSSCIGAVYSSWRAERYGCALEESLLHPRYHHDSPPRRASTSVSSMRYSVNAPLNVALLVSQAFIYGGICAPHVPKASLRCWQLLGRRRSSDRRAGGEQVRLRARGSHVGLTSLPFAKPTLSCVLPLHDPHQTAL